LNSVTVTKAKRHDLPSIRRLALDLIRTIDNTKSIDRSVISRNFRTLFRNANSHFLVAEIGKTIVGFVHITTRKTILHHGPSGLIDELVIAKRKRRKGIGGQLLSAAIQRCRELGCCEIELTTEKENKGAREFYKSFGLEERGIIFEMDLA
jgi:ribosomal protein S18 acetylase RimI-like enzyme